MEANYTQASNKLNADTGGYDLLVSGPVSACNVSVYLSMFPALALDLLLPGLRGELGPPGH